MQDAIAVLPKSKVFPFKLNTFTNNCSQHLVYVCLSGGIFAFCVYFYAFWFTGVLSDSSTKIVLEVSFWTQENAQHVQQSHMFRSKERDSSVLWAACDMGGLIQSVMSRGLCTD